MYQHIQFRVEDRVGRVAFARPPLNVLTIAMMREIDQALTECMGRREMVAVVFEAVKGSRAFSAGVSIEEHTEETVYQMLERDRKSTRLNSSHAGLSRMPSSA